MRTAGWTVGAATVVLFSLTARGQDAADVDRPTRPAYAADAGWARPLAWGIAGLFAAAGVVGPVVWRRARDTVPPAATHEEDPAADRRH